MAIPVHQKYILTISEASEYFSIGVKNLENLPDFILNLLSFMKTNILSFEKRWKRILHLFRKAKAAKNCYKETFKTVGNDVVRYEYPPQIDYEGL